MVQDPPEISVSTLTVDGGYRAALRMRGSWWATHSGLVSLSRRFGRPGIQRCPNSFQGFDFKGRTQQLKDSIPVRRRGPIQVQ